MQGTVKSELPLRASETQQCWTIISAEGEFTGVNGGKTLGTLNQVVPTSAINPERHGKLTLVGSHQEIPTLACSVPADTKRCVCRKKLSESGEAFLEVIGTVNEEILLQIKK